MMQPSYAMIEHSKKIHRQNMALCAASDPMAALERRLESFTTAWNLWSDGSFERERLAQQHPDLVDALQNIIGA